MVTCDIKNKNYFTVLFHNRVTTLEAEIKLFQPLEEF